jgi:hypothetical protein
MSEDLIAKWLDDRRSLDESEATELHRVLSADPALAQMVRDQLSTDDLASRRLGVDRRNFENQVAQRLVGTGSEGSFLKSTLDAVEQSDRRRAPWRAWMPEAAAAAILVVGLLLLLLRREAIPPPPTQAAPAASKPLFQGLRAQYYKTQTLQGKAVDRVDAVPDFTWKAGNPPIPTSKDVYSARWTGKLTPPVSGRYTLHARYDDGIRVWLDGKPVIDDWNGRYVIVDRRAEVDLESGRAYDLKIEYFNGGDRGVMQLFWSAAGRAEEIVPESVLSHE